MSVWQRFLDMRTLLRYLPFIIRMQQAKKAAPRSQMYQKRECSRSLA